VAKSGVHAFSPAALRRRRELRGFTISEVASLSGVSQASLSSWEAGKVVPTPGTLAAVAAALGTTVADLAPVRAAQVRMADLRHQAGLSQDQVAALIGTSRGTVTNIEAGARRPQPETFTALAHAYDTTEDVIVDVWDRTNTARMTRLRAR
jgi:transcriptional regulator with XRE-family HTH domain